MRYKSARQSAVEDLSKAVERFSLQDHDGLQPAAVAPRPSNTMDRSVYRLAANLLLKSLENLLDTGDYTQFKVTLEQTRLFLLLTQGEPHDLTNF